jgi:hypothetical protein
MATNEQDILVRIINKIVGEKDLVKESNLLRTLKKDNGDLVKVYEEQTNSQRKRVTVTKSHNKEGKETLRVDKETLAQGPRFQMHYLGIMFGGMALNRAMGNLTQTSREWVGIGELMSTTMGVVMLPATLTLLDTAVLPLVNALLSLPEDIQTTVGVTVLGLEGLGKIAEIGGQIALGAAAFSYQFPEMAAAIKKGLTSALAINIGKGIVVVAGLIIAWQSIDFIRDGIENGSILKELTGVLGMGLGLGLVGLTLAGPIGGLIGFTLGVAIGVVIDWFISKENNKIGLLGKVADRLRYGSDIETEGFRVMLDRQRFAKSGTSAQLYGSYANGMYTPPEKAVGGIIADTGTYTLHEGETVLRKDQTEMQGGNITVTYNVTVSDKKEFEQMLKANNQQLVRDVRRSSTI